MKTRAATTATLFLLLGFGCGETATTQPPPEGWHLVEIQQHDCSVWFPKPPNEFSLEPTRGYPTASYSYRAEGYYYSLWAMDFSRDPINESQHDALLSNATDRNNRRFIVLNAEDTRWCGTTGVRVVWKLRQSESYVIVWDMLVGNRTYVLMAGGRAPLSQVSARADQFFDTFALLNPES